MVSCVCVDIHRQSVFDNRIDNYPFDSAVRIDYNRFFPSLVGVEAGTGALGLPGRPPGATRSYTWTDLVPQEPVNDRLSVWKMNLFSCPPRLARAGAWKTPTVRRKSRTRIQLQYRTFSSLAFPCVIFCSDFSHNYVRRFRYRL